MDDGQTDRVAIKSITNDSSNSYDASTFLHHTEDCSEELARHNYAQLKTSCNTSKSRMQKKRGRPIGKISLKLTALDKLPRSANHINYQQLRDIGLGRVSEYYPKCEPSMTQRDFIDYVKTAFKRTDDFKLYYIKNLMFEEVPTFSTLLDLKNILKRSTVYAVFDENQNESISCSNMPNPEHLEVEGMSTTVITKVPSIMAKSEHFEDEGMSPTVIAKVPKTKSTRDSCALNDDHQLTENSQSHTSSKTFLTYLGTQLSKFTEEDQEDLQFEILNFLHQRKKLKAQPISLDLN